MGHQWLAQTLVIQLRFLGSSLLHRNPAFDMSAGAMRTPATLAEVDASPPLFYLQIAVASPQPAPSDATIFITKNNTFAI